MPDAGSRFRNQSRSEGKTSYVTSAVGLEETAGRLRARRTSLFMQTVIWVTGLVCLAFLCGALTQAWSNSQLMQQLQHEQQKSQQLQDTHNNLVRQASYYQDPYVVESEARQQLGYTRAGEHVVIVVGADNQNQSPSSSAAHHAAAQDFWQSWWNILFGNG